MENFLPFTDDVMVVLVHKCVQQTHLLALHLETLGYIPRLLNALNGLVYFLIIGDPRGDNLMVGSISRKLLTELGIRTEDAECKLMGDKCNFVIFVLIIKSCVGKPSSFFFGSFMFLFCLVFAMSLCTSVYMCFVVTCWERADLLALVCGA